MAEEVEKLAGDLDSLNRTLGISAIEFKGVTKSIITAADSTSQAGKAWTTFSRLVSGSGLWKLQNRLRAGIDLMAVYHDKQAKSLDQTNKQTKVMNQYMKLTAERIKIEDKLNAVLDEKKKYDEDISI